MKASEERWINGFSYGADYVEKVMVSPLRQMLGEFLKCHSQGEYVKIDTNMLMEAQGLLK